MFAGVVVWATWSVGEESCGDDGGVEEVGTDAFVEPFEVAEIVIVDHALQRDLQGNDPSVRPFDDEVDFVFTASSSQVTDSCFVGLGIDGHRKCDERFEQRAKQGAVSGNRSTLMGVIDQAVDIDTEDACGKRGVSELVNGRST